MSQSQLLGGLYFAGGLMILIIHEVMAKEYPITIKQLQYAYLVAIRHANDTYTVLKNRWDNTTPERIDRARMAELVGKCML